VVEENDNDEPVKKRRIALEYMKGKQIYRIGNEILQPYPHQAAEYVLIILSYHNYLIFFIMYVQRKLYLFYIIVYHQ